MNFKAEIAALKGMLDQPGGSERGEELWARTLILLERISDRVDTIARSQSEILNYVEALDDDLSVIESQLAQRGPDDEDDAMDFRAETSGPGE